MSHLTASTPLRHQLVRALRVGFAAGLVGGCAPPGDDSSASSPSESESRAISMRTTYIPIEDALSPSAGKRWAHVRERLFAQFDDVCGDTFCEGDWSNLEPLELSCSVTAKRGTVRECVWTFAASAEEVDAAGGTITASIPTFACRFQPLGTAEGLLRALHDDPLGAPLPGSAESIYDLLSDCFDSPSGAVPLEGGSLDGPYVDVNDGLDDETIDAWYAMTSALRSAYGESIDGEQREPRPLRFRCSMDENNQEIRTCAWTFAGATPFRKGDGLHRIHEERHVCSFTPEATPAELAAALGPLPTANVSPLDRPIPGGEATLRDVLDACF